MLEHVVTRGGAEGLMLRMPGSKYWSGRTSDLMKLKPQRRFAV
jgi:ATP-dependent DNA ligase